MVRLYLCEVRHFQIVNNLPYPALASYPLLTLHLEGFSEGALDMSYLPSYQSLLTFCRRYACYGHKFLKTLTASCCDMHSAWAYCGLCTWGSSLVHLCKYSPLICSPHRIWWWILTLRLHTWWSICIGARIILFEQVLGCILVPQDTLCVLFFL